MVLEVTDTDPQHCIGGTDKATERLPGSGMTCGGGTWERLCAQAGDQAELGPGPRGQSKLAGKATASANRLQTPAVQEPL
jgi:hypothetical protein